jgi:hypothetical protein
VLVSNQVPDVLIGDPWRFRQIITNLVGNSMKVSFRYLVASMFSFLASCSCVWSIPPLKFCFKKKKIPPLKLYNCTLGNTI